MIRRWQRPPRTPKPEIIEAPVVVAEGFELGGKLALNRPAIVNGRLRGLIQSTSHVTLGPASVVHADITARSVTVQGTVIGNVTAEESIHLETGSRVSGDLTAPAIAIDPGARFEGECKMAPLASPAAPPFDSPSVEPLRA